MLNIQHHATARSVTIVTTISYPIILISLSKTESSIFYSFMYGKNIYTVELLMHDYTQLVHVFWKTIDIQTCCFEVF